ncbi:MAG TPA: TIGR00159 family protein [Clostridiales bacterium]|nr:TIGR00159 family protein [Clostridiales bacterium]HBY32286.1 TIGR00159 family protein [Clostridiales bacterium]
MFENFTDFIREVFSSLDSGYMFFGGPLDLVRYVIDILLVTFVLYNILRIIRDTRAWQLLKGVLLILAFVLVCSFLGLEMVGYIFNKLLYIIAILFVVIFQPELRHALETVGLKSFSSFSNVILNDDSDEQLKYVTMVDEIVKACTEMSKTYTGAIMLLERSTKLSELLKQENVVRLDSSVTNSMLQSIFYKGSPMHDGALLIRDGRIIAARCHVPLSETLHMIERYGTRHRAAVGASEIGDTIAVVVSEERGTISVAVDGTLYEMKDGQDLRKNLFYLLGITSGSTNKHAIRSKKHNKKNGKKNVAVAASAAEPVTAFSVAASSRDASDDERDDETVPSVARKMNKAKKKKRSASPLLLLISFVFSLMLWMYIQVTTNPVTEKTFTLQLQYENSDVMTEKNLSSQYPIQNVTVRIVGRKNVVENLTASDLSAYVDMANVETTGSVRLKVNVKCDERVYFRVVMQRPEDIPISVYTLESEE